MKRIIILMIVLLVALPIALAQDPGTGSGSKILADENGSVFMEFSNHTSLCQDFMAQNDLIGFELPSYVPYKTEVFHMYYQDDEPLGFIELVDGKVVGAGCDIQGKPTFNVYVKGDETLLNIANAKNPLDAFNAARADGDIVIKGVSLGKKVKGFFTKIAASVASWFI